MNKKLLLIVLLFFAFGFFTNVFGQAIFTSKNDGDWNVVATWTKTGTDSDNIPDGDDIVNIANGHTIKVTAAADCSSITFTGANAALTVNSTLAVSGAVVLNYAGGNTATTISGSGTLSCASVQIGTDGEPGNNDAKEVTMTSKLVNFNITGNLTISSFIGSSIGKKINSIFSLESGTVKIDGTIITINENAANTSTFSMKNGAQTGTLLLSNPTPFSSLATTSIIALNGNGATVNYTGTAPIILGTTYQNLTFSGTGTTANPSGDLTIEGNLANTGAGIMNFSSRDITLSGNATQSIAGFSTTGSVFVTNTGVATFTGNVNGGGLIMDAGAELALGSFTHTFTGNWVMNGGKLRADSSLLKIGGNIIKGNDGSFLYGTATIELYANGAQNIGKLDFYNLTLSGSGIKTFGYKTAIENDLSIASAVVANLGTGFTHTANRLKLGGVIQDSAGSWGSTSSSANNRNNTYFAATDGIVNVATGYCTPDFKKVVVAPITKVVFNTISNASSALTTSPAYENYTNFKTNVTVGQTYTITVQGNTVGNKKYYYNVFFDWNQDGDFADSKEFYELGVIQNSTGTDGVNVYVDILVPLDALTGTTRMHIVSWDKKKDDPCPYNGSGQVEDYSINVEAVCTASVSISASANPVCSGTSVTFTATPTNGGAAPAYQWKLNGVDVGTNSAIYTNSTLANGDIVTCVMTSNATCATGSPATSNTVTMTVNALPTTPTIKCY